MRYYIVNIINIKQQKTFAVEIKVKYIIAFSCLANRNKRTIF